MFNTQEGRKCPWNGYLEGSRVQQVYMASQLQVASEGKERVVAEAHRRLIMQGLVQHQGRPS